MKTLTAVIAGGSHHKDIVLGALLERAGKKRVRLIRHGKFTAADVDDVRAGLHRLHNGAGQVRLRAGHDGAPSVICVNGDADATTGRRNTLDRAIVAAKEQAGNVCAMQRGHAPGRRFRAKQINLLNPGAGEAWMRQIDRAIEERNAHSWIATRVGPHFFNCVPDRF